MLVKEATGDARIQSISRHGFDPPGGRLTSIGISMIKIRWSHNCFVFNTQIPIPEKMVFVLKRGPRNLHVLLQCLSENQYFTNSGSEVSLKDKGSIR